MRIFRLGVAECRSKGRWCSLGGKGGWVRRCCGTEWLIVASRHPRVFAEWIKGWKKEWKPFHAFTDQSQDHVLRAISPRLLVHGTCITLPFTPTHPDSRVCSCRCRGDRICKLCASRRFRETRLIQQQDQPWGKYLRRWSVKIASNSRSNHRGCFECQSIRFGVLRREAIFLLATRPREGTLPGKCRCRLQGACFIGHERGRRWLIHQTPNSSFCPSINSYILSI